MDTKSQRDHQAEARKHNALKAYWEKCAGSQREEKKELTFQHQKIINRQTNSKWTSDSKPAQNVSSSKESKTVVSFAIGNVDGSRVPSLHFQNNPKPMERKLQGDKHDLVRRNCVSALEDRNTFRRSDDFQRTHQDDITNLRKSGELDFTEKIKAFRALIGAKPKSANSQHRVDGAAQELGNHVMFIAQSRDTINIGNEEAELVHKPEYNAKENRTKININGRVARELKDLSYVTNEDDLRHLNDPDFDHVTFQADIRALNFSLHEAEDHAYPMKQPNSSVVNQTSALERISASANNYDSGYRPSEGAVRDHVNKETQTSDKVKQVLEQDWNHVKTNHGRTRVIKRSRLHVPMDNKPFSADPKLFESRELTGEAHDENKFSDVTNTRQEHPNIKSTVSYAPGRDRSVPALNGTLRSMSTVPETTNNRLQPLELVERSKSVTPLSVKATPVSYSDNNGHIDTPFMTQLKSQISVLSASLECLSSIVSNVPDSGRNTARSGSAGPGSLSERSSLISESPSNFVGKASRHAHKVVNRKASESGSNSSISDSQSRYSGSSSLKQTNVRGLEGVENLRISDGNKGKRFNADIVHETEATKAAAKAHALPFKSDDLRKQELRKMVKYIYKRSNSWNNKHNPNRIHDDDTEMTRESNAGVAYLHSGKLGEEFPQTGKTISTPKGEEFTRTISKKSPLQTKSATGKINEKYNYKANTHAPLNNVRESVKEYTMKEEIRINVQNERTGSEPKIIKRNSQPTKGGQPTRSQSEVFFKNSLKEAIRHSPLPSKSNALQLLTKARPRSALHGLKSAPKTIEVQKNVSISRKDKKAKSQKLKDAHIPLKEKLQQLRSEIDKRLSSKENLAHFVQTYKLKELIGDEMGTNSEEHSLEDSSSYDSKSSESTEKRDSDGSFSEAVSTVTHYSSNDDIKNKAKAKHPFTAEEFLTSTPVKAPSTKQDDGNIYNQAGRNLMFSHTHRTFKKPSNIVTSEAMKERQLFQTSSALESRLPYDSNKDSTRASNDDFNLLLTKQEKTLNLDDENVVIEPVTLHRSGSVGSKALSVNGRKDIMNRILTKMATRQESVSSSSSNTRSLQWPTVPSSGRESPAERLLNHLDNPRQIKLLQMLYQADPITRQIIMIKVEYFTAWHDFTIASRERRLKKNKLMKLKGFLVDSSKQTYRGHISDEEADGKGQMETYWVTGRTDMGECNDSMTCLWIPKRKKKPAVPLTTVHEVGDASAQQPVTNNEAKDAVLPPDVKETSNKEVVKKESSDSGFSEVIDSFEETGGSQQTRNSKKNNVASTSLTFSNSSTSSVVSKNTTILKDERVSVISETTNSMTGKKLGSLVTRKKVSFKNETRPSTKHHRHQSQHQHPIRSTSGANQKILSRSNSKNLISPDPASHGHLNVTHASQAQTPNSTTSASKPKRSSKRLQPSTVMKIKLIGKFSRMRRKHSNSRYNEPRNNTSSTNHHYHLQQTKRQQFRDLHVRNRSFTFDAARVSLNVPMSKHVINEESEDDMIKDEDSSSVKTDSLTLGQLEDHQKSEKPKTDASNEEKRETTNAVSIGELEELHSLHTNAIKLPPSENVQASDRDISLELSALLDAPKSANTDSQSDTLMASVIPQTPDTEMEENERKASFKEEKLEIEALRGRLPAPTYAFNKTRETEATSANTTHHNLPTKADTENIILSCVNNSIDHVDVTYTDRERSGESSLKNLKEVDQSGKIHRTPSPLSVHSLTKHLDERSLQRRMESYQVLNQHITRLYHTVGKSQHPEQP
uniref:Uncharacterized protein n=1 Tax=Biomphalaria glabrata TaxID=6526 RepID=A0A2C9LY64_BIOGL